MQEFAYFITKIYVFVLEKIVSVRKVEVMMSRKFRTQNNFKIWILNGSSGKGYFCDIIDELTFDRGFNC